MMTKVHFFVRLISGGTIVLVASSTDTISCVLEKIQSRMGNPSLSRQCLIYQGKQLQLEQKLEECGVGNDSELKLSDRMESTSHPGAWHFINNNFVPFVFSLCKKNTLPETTTPTLVRSKLSEFLSKWAEANHVESHLEIFTASSVPQALVMLYMSSHRDVADDVIRMFINSINANGIVLPNPTRHQCIIIVLEFCKLLGLYVGSYDSLYRFCRDNLRVMVLKGEEDGLEKGMFRLHKIFPFAQELAIKLSRDLMFSNLEESFVYRGPSLNDIKDFDALLSILTIEIEGDPTYSCQIKVPFNEQLSRLPLRQKKKITYFREVFLDLLDKFDTCLKKIEENMGWVLSNCTTVPKYFTILKQLNIFSKLYNGCNEIFRDTMKRRKRTISYLIVNYAKRNDDISWIIDCKELMEFEAKRHLTLMMLPELNNNGESFQMLIDRSHLLAQSFEYIVDAQPDSLRAGLFIWFKKERATGPGVLREWFVLVCEEIFNPQNALFVACPNDHRRFLPNPASKVNPGHLQYFRFCGRVIALALMRRIHIGIVLDRAFVLQLAGDHILLEDIRDADPYLYSSCKQILEMDAEIVDQDALSLTFVHEIEEFGKRKNVELCAGGTNMVVNSKNRMQYVDSLIQQRFVTSIGQQVEHFASGFADIASPQLQKLFFKCLNTEDLDRMLHGSESLISVDDWRAHTDYHGFKRTGSHITWFWETVSRMSQDQKKVLLFFWTSIKYLPIEGFGGLASRLHIHKTDEPSSRLPTSHTCFYQLCFPAYRSLSVTRARLGIITQEHVGCSFGTL